MSYSDDLYAQQLYRQQEWLLKQNQLGYLSGSAGGSGGGVEAYAQRLFIQGATRLTVEPDKRLLLLEDDL